MESPTKRKGMLGFYILTGVVFLFVVLAVVNWKEFHLAYCKHLMKSADAADRLQGVIYLARTHFKPGMSQQEIRRLLRPLSPGRGSSAVGEAGRVTLVVEISLPECAEVISIRFVDGAFVGFSEESKL